MLLLLFTSFFSCSKIDLPNSFRTERSQSISAATETILSTNLIYEETFEGSTYFPTSGTSINKTQNIENCGLDWTLSTVKSPVFVAYKASRFEIRKDQPLVGTAERIRSEVTIIKGTDDNRFTPEMWYSFAVLFPSVGFEYDVTRECINQWYEDGDKDNTIKTEKNKAYLEVTPPLGSTTTRKYDLFSLGSTTTTDITSFISIPKNEWHEFIFHFIHSKEDDGLIEVWRDGVKTHTIKGRNMDLQYPKWKLGLYKWDFVSSSQYSRVIYFDNIRVGKASSSFTDMLSSNPNEPIRPVNVPPTVDAGKDLEITLPVNIVTLRGKASDTDGYLSSTTWTKIVGPIRFAFSDTNMLQPVVSNLKAGVYTFRLTVVDSKGAIAKDDVIVKVNDAPPATFPASITSFNLINSETESSILTIKDGATYSLAQLGIKRMNIRANPDLTTNSVKFELSGPQSKTYSDNAIPYALMGDDGFGNYYYGVWNPPLSGSYTLKATPYNLSIAGTSSTIHFTLTK